jgi:RimJ/RimL family protein N-acetyltransferase
VIEVPELETERLVLRAWRDEDLDAWAALCADDEVMRALGRPGGLSREDAWREMAFLAGHWQLKGFGHWALEERASRELVGRAGLFAPEAWPGLEVGWMVGRLRWGRGYAGEAARAAMEWAATALRAPRVISLIADDNLRSQRVAEKLGMTVEGRAVVRGTEVRVYGVALPGTRSG